MGSKKDVNKVEADKQTTAIETVLTLMEQKKVIQCNPTTTPVAIKEKICFKFNVIFGGKNTPIKTRDKKAIPVR